MQLILDSEPALAIERDMSAGEDIHSEKLGNGNIVKLSEENCNGNKENIGDVNFVTNDDKNKQAINADTDNLPSLPVAIQSEDTDILELNEEVCEADSCKTNGVQNEDTQEVTNVETEDIDTSSQESDNIEETAQEAVEEDMIIKEESGQIPDTEGIQSGNVISDTDNIEIKEKEYIQNDIEVVLESVHKPKIEEPVKFEETSSENKEYPKEDGKKKNIDEANCEPMDVVSNDDSSPIELKDDMDDDVVIEESVCENIVVDDDADDDIVAKDPVVENNVVEDDVAVNKVVENIVVEDKVTEDAEDVVVENNVIENIVVEDDVDEGKKAEDVVVENKVAENVVVEDIVVQATKITEPSTASPVKELPTAPVSTIVDKPVICKLSNNLDILSDDEEDPTSEEAPKVKETNEKQCFDIEDDDDIMLIDEDMSKSETPPLVSVSHKEETTVIANEKPNSETANKTVEDSSDLFTNTEEKDSPVPAEVNDSNSKINLSKKQEEKEIDKCSDLPLLPENFLKTAKKNLADMTREDLEEFCVLKIVESIVDRSNLSEIKNKLKTVAQGIEEYRKTTMMLTKQNRDLQVVLKSIQEEQKKMTPGTPITPLKITRSVGMQVFMEKTGARRKNLAQLQNSNITRPNAGKSVPVGPAGPRPQKSPINNQSIPVPRLVPANSPANKSTPPMPTIHQIFPGKSATPLQNGIKTPPQKVGEKRQHNRIMSVTVDLTDDEPPNKLNNRMSPAPPVRVVPQQSLMATPRQAYSGAVSSPRKVYIPISGPQNQNIRAGQTILLKNVPSPGLRPRCPTPQVTRATVNSTRTNRVQPQPPASHPAPLPDAMKQYQPPNWKALPPPPELKLSKVENGIVISWKIDGYQEDEHEEIASYQLYAYQETSNPPSTTLWKKIGDVKALPLPMACTLTQFMAGFKYYFAVRAIDVRSRIGPFSLPGSILLLNKY